MIHRRQKHNRLGQEKENSDVTSPAPFERLSTAAETERSEKRQWVLHIVPGRLPAATDVHSSLGTTEKYTGAQKKKLCGHCGLTVQRSVALH